MHSNASRTPPTIDSRAAERWTRMTPREGSPWLHEEVGRRMEERLQWITAEPRSWLDWSPLRGGLQAHALVARRYRDAAAYVIEPQAALQAATKEAFAAAPWWSLRRWRMGRGAAPRIGAEAVPEAGVDLLWANMALHMAADPLAVITQWHRLVATNGFLMFSCLGPDTARELRALYARMGWPVPGHEFTDMHDWGDMLIGAGFAEPVMDMEHIVLHWSSPQAMREELRGLGRNLHPQRFGALRGKGWGQALDGALAEMAIDAPEGRRISMTFEIVYGHAFKPAPRVRLAKESTVPLQEMRELLRRGRAGD